MSPARGLTLASGSSVIIVQKLGLSTIPPVASGGDAFTMSW